MSQGTEVRIVANGDFGWAVAGHLHTLLNLARRPVRTAREPMDVASECFMAGGGFGVRAAWRDVRAEFASFASAARSAGAPWLPVAVGHPYIRIGPAIVPGVAPCHSCYLARARQHDTSPNAEVEKALTTNTQLGVRGYPPHLTMLAAGLALSLMRTAEAGRAGMLMTIDSRTDAVSNWRVVPCPDCPDCDER